jgi:hypothetical protein
MDNSTFPEELILLFKKRYPKPTLKLESRISLTLNAFWCIPPRIAAYFAFNKFVRDAINKTIEESQNKLTLSPPHPLETHIVASKDAIIESCIVSFAKPFTKGNEGAEVESAGKLEPFLRNDLCPLVENTFNIPMLEIVKKVIATRHQMVAHIDAEAFDLKINPSGAQMKGSISDYSDNDIINLSEAALNLKEGLRIVNAFLWKELENERNLILKAE